MDDGYFGGAAAYVNYHAAPRVEHRQPDSERRCHRLVDEENVASPGMLGGVANGTDLNFGRSGRNSHYNLKVRGEEAVTLAVNFLDEAADHHLRRVEVGDHAIAQRPDGLDAGVCPFLHQLGFLAYSDTLVGIIVNGYDARLVQHYLVILIDDGVGRSKVDCQFLIQKRKRHFPC